MPQATNYFVNELKPIRRNTLGTLRSTFSKRPNAALVYEYLRGIPVPRPGTPLSLSGIGDDIGIKRDSVRRALETLARTGWLRRNETAMSGPGDIVWELRPRGRMREKSFRGWDIIQVVPDLLTLGAELDSDEQRQLFLGFMNETRTAALYLHLRKEATTHDDDYPAITMAQLAQVFACKSQSITGRLRRLERMSLIERDAEAGALVVKYVACVEDGPVDEKALQRWFQDPALQPPPKLDLGELVGRKTIRAQSQLILDFFEKATKARGKGSMAGMAHGGLKTANERAARNLARDWMFKDLQVPLIFFVFEWRGDAVDEYGRTLTTFQHNLPAILEEVEEFMPTDRMYPTRMMKRYGLDAFFPIPETKEDRAAKIREEKAARYAEARRKEEEEDWVAPERPVRRPSRTRQMLLARRRIAS